MGNKVSSMLQDEEIKLISEETGFSATQIERLYLRFTSLDKSGICGSLSRQDFLRVPELAINPLCDRIVHMFFVDCDEDHERINFRQFMKVLATFRSSAHPFKCKNDSRQESIENILSSLSQNEFRHSRHSSCDGFINYFPVQHHTTNQHSIHYVASTTQLASIGSHQNHYANGNHNGISNYKQQLVNPEEPPNSRKQKMYFIFKIYDVNNDDLIDIEDLVSILKMMVGTYVDEARVRRIAERTLREADKNCDGFIDFNEFCQVFSYKDIDESMKVKFSCSS